MEWGSCIERLAERGGGTRRMVRGRGVGVWVVNGGKQGEWGSGIWKTVGS